VHTRGVLHVLVQGMVNIRGDDDLTAAEVLSEFQPRHVDEVLAMKADPQVRFAYSMISLRDCRII